MGPESLREEEEGKNGGSPRGDLRASSHLHAAQIGSVTLQLAGALDLARWVCF